MKIILAAAPVSGHVNPVLALARILIAAGHEVVCVSGTAFKPQIEKSGARFRALPVEADFDGNALDEVFPKRKTLSPGPAQIRFDLERVVIGMMPAQFAALQTLLQEFPAKLIVADIGFLGTWPFLLGAAVSRPAIATLGVTFLTLRRDDDAPAGPGLLPATDDATIAQYRNIATDVDAALWHPVRRRADAVLEQLGARPLPVPYLDAMVTLGDIYLQPSVRGFEYPRKHLPDSVRFIGPLATPSDIPMSPSVQAALSKMDKRIVLVTQGTLANTDLGQLLGQTLAALADRTDVLVLATTGGRPVSEVPGPIPANAIVEPMLPFDRIMPSVDVLITNGGYGTVAYALSIGVPIVVAGLSEEKPEIAARVVWTGAGVSLRTDRPTSQQLRDAVDGILRDPGYRERAGRLAREATLTSAMTSIPALLENVVDRFSKR